MDTKKQRKFYNRCNLISANRGAAKDFKILKLAFSTWDAEEKAPVRKYTNLFLTQENNERNQETLQHLGCTNVPDMVTFDTVQKLEGLGTRVVDLVTEDNDAGYENVKYINEPKFGVRVFDMREKGTF